MVDMDSVLAAGYERMVDSVIAKIEESTLSDEDYMFKPMYSTTSITQRDLTYSQLVEQRRRAYDLFEVDPSVAQFINILNSATFGSGVDTPVSDDERIQALIDEIWNNPDNQRVVFSPLSMRNMNTQLVVNGELFFVLVRSGNTLRISFLDPNEITAVVISDQDSTKPVLYERTYNETTYDFDRSAYTTIQNKKQYYADFMANESDPTIRRAIKAGNFVPNYKIFHVKVNTLGMRGIPEISRCYDWARAHARSIGDQLTVSKSLAKFSWIQKIATKSSAAIAAMGNKIAAASPTAGATVVQNQASELTPVNIPTGSVQNLDTAIRNSHIESIRSLGFGEHYYADNSSGNLATASAMELPAIWKIQERQLIWETIIKAILEYAVKLNNMQAGHLDIEFPPAKILSTQEASQMVTSIIAASQAGLIDEDEASIRIYKLIGSNNINKLMEDKENGSPEPVSAPEDDDNANRN